jgi:hypothetical protein
MSPRREQELVYALVRTVAILFIGCMLGFMGGVYNAKSTLALHCSGKAGGFIVDGVVYRCAPIKPATYDGESYRNVT